jgi:hypothetical protein
VRLALVALALLLPAPLFSVAGAALADRIGQRLGAASAELGEHLQVRAETPVPAALLLPLGEALEPEERRSRTAAPEPGGLPRGRVQAAASGSVTVRAESVLRLASVGARPSAVPVRAQGDRPAGLALIGVSGLGVGLVDGDILTHAGGAAARSAGEVVGLVIASRGARVSQISGRFWRRGRYYHLVVEQPYLEPRPAEGARLASTFGG